MDNQENDLKLSTEVESQGLPLDHVLNFKIDMSHTIGPATKGAGSTLRSVA